MSNDIAAEVRDLERRLEGPDGVSLINLSYSRDGHFVTLHLIRVDDPAQQRQGRADQAVRALTRFADSRRVTLALTPSPDFGASRPRLEKWYRRHGFVPNRGRTRDFLVRESMIRRPRP